MNPLGLPRVTPDLRGWAMNLTRYLSQTASKLRYKSDDVSAPADGTILWDAAGGYPVVSKSGEWRQIVLADGYAVLGQDADITAAAANTAYKIALDDIITEGITLTGSPLTEITFVEGGLYSLSFSAQISSTSGSTVYFRFWPRINGSDAAGSTILASLHNNGATTTVSRTAIFSVSAGDVLNVMWATTSTNGFLHAHSATAYAPASPSVTLVISRINS
jgi:hypothetical protein